MLLAGARRCRFVLRRSGRHHAEFQHQPGNADLAGDHVGILGEQLLPATTEYLAGSGTVQSFTVKVKTKK